MDYDKFVHCDGCGLLFDYGLILTSDVVGHWLEVDDDQLSESIKDPQEAYELLMILECYSSTHRGQCEEDVAKIASRIINLKG